jgi:hypothetical protein
VWGDDECSYDVRVRDLCSVAAVGLLLGRHGGHRDHRYMSNMHRIVSCWGVSLEYNSFFPLASSSSLGAEEEGRRAQLFTRDN